MCSPCPESNQPFAAVCMVTPPPCAAPTAPQPVKPLQMPCPPCPRPLTQEEAEELRYANFYNNYNIPYNIKPCPVGNNSPEKCRGQTLVGTNPCCRPPCNKPVRDEGCPTGFKPCQMKMYPPPGNHPCGVWCAQVMPCPPKKTIKVSYRYNPGPCRRPGCKHWKPKDPPCCYDMPCRAHCYDHPPGIKGSGRMVFSCCPCS